VPENPADGVRPEDPEDGTVRVLDPRALRALAHPLRMRIIAALREYGPATASGLGSRLGESSGATSYHLRQLAAHGFVEDDPERGNGRERWWRTVHRGTRFDSVNEFLEHPDPEVRGAMHSFMHQIAVEHAEQLTGWLGTAHEWPGGWRTAGDMSNFTLRLTPELLLELGEKVHALIESYHGRVPEPPADEHPRSPAADGSATVRLHFHAFPRRAD
jgi:DNA-binding transcriptional ArsR family regulator